MGKVSILTNEQKIVLDEIKKDPYISANFYFTGGTALSVFYLQHRYSEDLDFFSLGKYSNETIFSIIQRIAKLHHLTFHSRFVEPVYIFNLIFKNGISVKIDFSWYPYKLLSKGTNWEGLSVDSLLDMAVNKTLTLNQRTDVKDFVDFYFLEPKFGIWDLILGVESKFKIKTEPVLLAADLLKAEDFEFLPRMIKPLTLQNLKEFCRKKAKEIAAESIK